MALRDWVSSTASAVAMDSNRAPPRRRQPSGRSTAASINGQTTASQAPVMLA